MKEALLYCVCEKSEKQAVCMGDFFVILEMAKARANSFWAVG